MKVIYIVLMSRWRRAARRGVCVCRYGLWVVESLAHFCMCYTYRSLGYVSDSWFNISGGHCLRSGPRPRGLGQAQRQKEEEL